MAGDQDPSGTAVHHAECQPRAAAAAAARRPKSGFGDAVARERGHRRAGRAELHREGLQGVAAGGDDVATGSELHREELAVERPDRLRMSVAIPCAIKGAAGREPGHERNPVEEVAEQAALVARATHEHVPGGVDGEVVWQWRVGAHRRDDKAAVAAEVGVIRARRGQPDQPDTRRVRLLVDGCQGDDLATRRDAKPRRNDVRSPYVRREVDHADAGCRSSGVEGRIELARGCEPGDGKRQVVVVECGAAVDGPGHERPTLRVDLDDVLEVPREASQLRGGEDSAGPEHRVRVAGRGAGGSGQRHCQDEHGCRRPHPIDRMPVRPRLHQVFPYQSTSVFATRTPEHCAISAGT